VAPTLRALRFRFPRCAITMRPNVGFSGVFSRNYVLHSVGRRAEGPKDENAFRSDVRSWRRRRLSRSSHTRPSSILYSILPRKTSFCHCDRCDPL
jgi:hypothetical protein